MAALNAPQIRLTLIVPVTFCPNLAIIRVQKKTFLRAQSPGGSTNYQRSVVSVTPTGNESVPKIIINDTVNFFLKLQSAFW